MKVYRVAGVKVGYEADKVTVEGEGVQLVVFPSSTKDAGFDRAGAC